MVDVILPMLSCQTESYCGSESSMFSFLVVSMVTEPSDCLLPLKFHTHLQGGQWTDCILVYGMCVYSNISKQSS